MLLIQALLSPFCCFIKGLYNYRSKNSKYYVLIFILFYAFTMTFPEGETNMDIFRRIEFFKQFASQPNLSIETVFINAYSDDGSDANADVFESFLIYLISRFTNDVRWMLVFWALSFGLLFVNNIWYVIEKINFKINKINVIWFVGLFLIIPFWNINAFRFWIASQLFIFGILRVLFTKKKSYLFVSLLSFLGHFSFLIPNFLLLFFFVLPKNLKTANIIFLITLLITSFNIQNFTSIVDFLPLGVRGKFISYTSDIYLERVNEMSSLDLNLYVSLRYKFLLLVFELMFLLIYYKHKDFLNNKLNSDLLFLSFILMSFSNLVFEIRPLDRFFNLGFFFVILIGLNFSNYLIQNNKKSLVFKFLSFLLILYIIVEIRIGFDTISIVSIIGNPITQYFVSDSNFSLIDIFK